MKQLNWYQIFGESHKIPDGRTVTPTDDIQIWLHCADIWDKTYTTLAEVLADTSTLVMLMSIDNAVDYLVRSTTWAGIKVPTMTSDNTPSGECFGSSYYSESLNRYNYYRAFDGTISSSEGWNSNETSPTEYIGYDFTENVVVAKVDVAIRETAYPQRNVILRGSHDKVTWDDISVLAANISDTSIHTYTVSNSTAYRYYSIQSTAGNGNVVTFSYIQFYSENLCDSETAMKAIGASDYASTTLLSDSTWNNAIQNSTYFESVDNVKVPAMTSDTTPSGVASASSALSGYDAYKAFNGDAITVQGWTSTEVTDAWIAYDFSSEVKLNAINIAPFCQADGGGLRAKDFILQGYDGSGWVDIYESTIPNASQVTNNYYSFINTTAYSKYRLYVKNSYATNGGYIIINELQFYGRENGGVQTWLRSAGITNKSYITLAEVLADTTTLATLMANHNAVDYLVTCKGWATTICADANAMGYIGQNNYCANTLLADETWCSAIANSTYFESVLNVKVPTMTSDNTPSGECIASGVSYGAIWKAFRNTYATSDDGNYWQSEANNSHVWIGYVFENPVTIKSYFQRRIYSTNNTRDIYTVHVQSSSDGISWNNISDLITVDNSSANAKTSANFASNTTPCRYYRIYEESGVTAGKILTQVQFYGRKDV